MATPSTAVGDTPRPPLNRERIIGAAIDIADREGVDRLSMRKLAAALGYEAMSLYNHVANKQELLEAMLDGIFGELDPPDPSGGWKVAIRRRAVETHRMLLRHPWAPPQLPVRFPGAHRWAESEFLLARLAEADFDDHTGDLGYHAITLHIGGFTQQQLSYAMDDERTKDGLERVARAAGPPRYPLMHGHVAYHLEMNASPAERPDEFEFVLDLILDGLDRMRSPTE